MTKSVEAVHTENFYFVPEWEINIQTPSGGLDVLATALDDQIDLFQGQYSHCMYVRDHGRCRFKSEEGAHGGAENTIQEVDSVELIISIPQSDETLIKLLDVINEFHVHEEPTVRLNSTLGLRSKYAGDADNPNKYWNKANKDKLHGKAIANVGNRK